MEKKMTSLTTAERKARERQVATMLQDGLNVVEIAQALGVTKQAAWEFLGRRGWLQGEDQGRYTDRIAANDERRRLLREREKEAGTARPRRRQQAQA